MRRELREPEITSMVRHFFRLNGFTFLSTSSSGEKLYYTIGGNKLNNKQPDTIVIKNDLLVLCEDKIKFNSLFSSRNKSLNDHDKLLAFLTSDPDLYAFKQKVALSTSLKDYSIIGCLSSLAPTKSILSIDHPLLISLSIDSLAKDRFMLTLKANAIYHKYFNQMTIETKLS